MINQTLGQNIKIVFSWASKHTTLVIHNIIEGVKCFLDLRSVFVRIKIYSSIGY